MIHQQRATKVATRWTLQGASALAMPGPLSSIVREFLILAHTRGPFVSRISQSRMDGRTDGPAHCLIYSPLLANFSFGQWPRLKAIALFVLIPRLD